MWIGRARRRGILVMLALCLGLGAYLFLPKGVLAPERALAFFVYTPPADGTGAAPAVQEAGATEQEQADAQANLQAVHTLLPFFLSPAPGADGAE